MFVGRHRELAVLEDAYDSGKGELVVICRSAQNRQEQSGP